jgi:serine/threonine protein kinase/Flp pilus assembly protein TadD
MSRQVPNPELVFAEIIEIESPEKRAAFLDRACGHDPEFRRAMEKLVLDHFRAGQFLEMPAHVVVTADHPDTERPGTLIGPYKLLELIGEGGMGLVYVAEQQKPVRRKVALKIIKPGMDSRQVIARFEAERQALALMDHPNIAKILDGGMTSRPHAPREEVPHAEREAYSGRPYFVMELVKGKPITEYCDRNKLGTRQRLELFLDVCHAVQHAHQKGIIHRDLKPSNILVEVHDVRPVVKIIDFGIAKAIGQQLSDKTLYTGIAQMIGTPLYMSPEQAGLSSLDVDTRSDVYALGVLLYELLTGTTPFDSETLKKAGYDEMRRIIREDEPAKPSARLSTLHQEALSTIANQRGMEPRKLNQQMRGELDWIVMRALEKDRNRRYESASAFGADVQRYLQDEPVQACPPSNVYRLGKFLRRHRTGVLTATVMLVAAVALAVGLGWMARDQAVRQAIIKGEVQRALKEVQSLQEQGRWQQALGIARQTQTLLETSAKDELIQLQVRERVNDLRMILRLEEIRLNDLRMLRGGTMPELERVNNKYSKAFQEYGLDVDTVPLEEAATIIRAKSVPLELAMALDVWARMRRGLKNKDHGWQRLNALARAADPDEWRNQFRQVWESGDEKVIGAPLEKLLASAKVDDLLPETIVLLAEALAMADRGDQAVAFLRTAQRRHSGNFWINQALASWLANSSPPRYDEAIHYFFASFACRPDYPISRVDVAYAFLQKGKVDEAMTYLGEAIRLKPDYAAAYNGLGAVLLHQKDLTGAVAHFQKAIELSPKFSGAYNNLGIALFDQKDLTGAIAHFQKAIDLDPKYARAYSNLGNALHEQKDLMGAESAYRKFLELNQGGSNALNVVAFNDLGNVLYHQKDPTGAIGHYQKAIELDPKYAFAYSNLGNVLHEQKDLTGAIDACKKAIDLDPKLAGAYNNLGDALLDQKDLTGAIAHYQKAIELDPKFARAYANLGNALRDQKDLTGALAALSKAVEIYLASGQRYDAASATARFGSFQSTDAADTDAAELKSDEMVRLRGQSLTLLRTELEALRSKFDKNPEKLGSSVRQTMQYWQRDTDFDGVRDPDALAKLPESERQAWQALWREVEELRERTSVTEPRDSESK